MVLCQLGEMPDDFLSVFSVHRNEYKVWANPVIQFPCHIGWVCPLPKKSVVELMKFRINFDDIGVAVCAAIFSLQPMVQIIPAFMMLSHLPPCVRLRRFSLQIPRNTLRGHYCRVLPPHNVSSNSICSCHSKLNQSAVDCGHEVSFE